jgi:hypothetical protein
MNTKRRAAEKRRETKDLKTTLSLSLPVKMVEKLKGHADFEMRNLSGMVAVMIEKYGKPSTEN